MEEETEILSSSTPIDQFLEKELCSRITNSDCYKGLLKLQTLAELSNEIVDEDTKTEVHHVEAWTKGEGRKPSIAFCLLYRFFKMKPSVKQVHHVLTYPGQPYLRAIGFLYLRCVALPNTLWDWFHFYMLDNQKIRPGFNSEPTTMGVYLRDLLLGKYYFGTHLPPIPRDVMRGIISELEKLQLPTIPSGTTGGTARGSTGSSTFSGSHRNRSLESSDQRRGHGRHRDSGQSQRDESSDRGRRYSWDRDGDCDRRIDRYQGRDRSEERHVGSSSRRDDERDYRKGDKDRYQGRESDMSIGDDENSDRYNRTRDSDWGTDRDRSKKRSFSSTGNVERRHQYDDRDNRE